MTAADPTVHRLATSDPAAAGVTVGDPAAAGVSAGGPSGPGVSAGDPSGPGAEGEPTGTAGNPGRFRRLRRLAMPLYVVLVAGGIALALRGAGTAPLGQLLTADAVPYLATAVAANVVALLLGMVSWQAALHSLAGRVAPLVSTRIYFVGFLGKFVPGRVWTLLAHIRLGRQAGLDMPVIVATFALSLAITTFTGLAVGLVVASGMGGHAAWLVLPGLAVVAGLVRPRAVSALVRRVGRLVRRPLDVPDGGEGAMRAAIVTQLLCWAVSGLHLWALLVPLGADPVRALPAAVGGFALAMVLGGLAVVVPDGAGVRELILFLALAPLLPLPAIGVAVVASRVVCLLTEVAVSGAVVGGTELVRLRRRRTDGERRRAGRLRPAGR